MTAKRGAPHKNSVAAISNALMDRVAGPLRLPKHLAVPARVQPFVDDLLSARARHEWNSHELVLVVQSARMLFDLTNTKMTPREQIETRRALLSLLRTLRIAGWRPNPRPTLPHVEDGDDLLAL